MSLKMLAQRMPTISSDDSKSLMIDTPEMAEIQARMSEIQDKNSALRREIEDHKAKISE